MTITEFIYTDDRRLDSYFEQISSSINYKKVPTWKVALGLSALNVEATQSVSPVPFTKHEKISKLVQYLRKHGELADRPYSTDMSFVLETLHASRAFIPAHLPHAPNFPGIAIWLCLPSMKDEKTKGYRYLIEDFTKADEPAHSAPSGWSAFFLLLDQLSVELRAMGIITADFDEVTLLERRVPWRFIEELEKDNSSGSRLRFLQALLQSQHFYLPDIVISSEDVSQRHHLYNIACQHQRYRICIIDEAAEIQRQLIKAQKEDYRDFECIYNQLQDLSSSGEDKIAIVKIRRDRCQEFGEQFAKNPIVTLESLGAHIGPSPTIDALYRTREILSDSAFEDYAVIGYPIIITENPSSL